MGRVVDYIDRERTGIIPSATDEDVDRSSSSVEPPVRKLQYAERGTKNERPEKASSESSVPVEEAEYSEELARQRAVAALLAARGGLAFVLLSYLGKAGAVAVQDLLEWGPKDELFALLFDLYDFGFLERRGGTVSLSEKGVRLTRKAGLYGDNAAE
jgi:hypothetical protein